MRLRRSLKRKDTGSIVAGCRVEFNARLSSSRYAGLVGGDARKCRCLGLRSGQALRLCASFCLRVAHCTFGITRSLSQPVLSAQKQQVDAHADAHDGEEGGEGDGLDGDLAGDPGAGAELARDADVVENSGDVDDDAEGDEGNAGIDGEAGVAGGDLLGAVKFAQEKAEAREGEADAHEAEAGANPRKEGAFGGEVNARVVDFSGHRGIVLGAGC